MSCWHTRLRKIGKLRQLVSEKEPQHVVNVQELYKCDICGEEVWKDIARVVVPSNVEEVQINVPKEEKETDECEESSS